MKENLAKKILMGLLLAGVLVIAASSPYLLINIAKSFSKDKKYERYGKRNIAKTLSYLKRNNLIILSEKNDEITVKLTENGERKTKQYQFDKLEIQKPKKWDNKWRMVIFDIPEKNKKMARNALREKLEKLYFFQLQKSVWVHPHPCENEIQLIAEMFGVTPFVNIILVDKISNDVKLKAHFKLL